MTRIAWDQAGQRRYENGVDHGVLYLRDGSGNYTDGYAWNGLTTVTESPSGAESNKQYADNMVYVNLKSAEEFAATIEAFTYPDEFMRCDGTLEPEPGVMLGQQRRETFGFSYRSLIGNDLTDDAGYKIHLVYGGDAAPTETAHTTVNDSPEAAAFSWEVSTIPVAVGVIGGTEYKPTAKLTVDSTKADPASLVELEDILYGTPGADPRLPLPAEVVSMFSGVLIEAETTPPTYNSTTDVVTIPAVTGVIYTDADGVDLVAGPTAAITEDTVYRAKAAPGYKLSDTSDTDWTINFV